MKIREKTIKDYEFQLGFVNEYCIIQIQMCLLFNTTSDWITLKIAREYPAIYCLKRLDVINYVTFYWMTCDMQRSKSRRTAELH